ncbi:MAG: hypothetical protein AVDCRST_MAG57-40 [uncultured Blastococcus sp.]|uniref:Uncharacterized protein n=1 Tax=uncultured Blastococcus sp. TaxID=217144 RepID=A0A6J4GZ60_9ACTN|nr:MAG: hypothetical protein AVDCRST_MAG57-40 [uncultured Blastococcus sp.]
MPVVGVAVADPRRRLRGRRGGPGMRVGAGTGRRGVLLRPQSRRPQSGAMEKATSPMIEGRSAGPR